MSPSDASEITDDEKWMGTALELARRGEGHVEPNPMVGCVIVKDQKQIGWGYHRQFGGQHAEIMALEDCSISPSGADVYVTLEPCCHHGKTPPCTDALIAANVRRVVVADQDPNPEVSGRGLQKLREAGIQVDLGISCNASRQLTAPYRKLHERGRPWVIAKWAMTLDGKIATRTGESQWISSGPSRQVVHQLRGRVDAILVGLGTAKADDPLLTARQPGPRAATRIVVDTNLEIDPASQLVSTAEQYPTLIACGNNNSRQKRRTLESAGCEVLTVDGEDHATRLIRLLNELGQRQMTNLLVEGGGKLIGSLLDIGEIDEVHVFVAPKIVGGEQAPSPVAGRGVSCLKDALQCTSLEIQSLVGDIYLRGRILR